ncbi:hypothetical protein GW17_00059191, partial [Ensete ventricosum]
MSRDFGYYWLRLLIYIVVTICIGTIYLNVGTGYTSILKSHMILHSETMNSSHNFHLQQGIFMLVSGYFRLPNDIPKPFWRYPMSYISFHYWALQSQMETDALTWIVRFIVVASSSVGSGDDGS